MALTDEARRRLELVMTSDALGGEIADAMDNAIEDNFGSDNTSSLAALGNSQGTAAAITTSYTKATGADGTKGIILPAASAGLRYWVFNSDTSNNLKVYPATGDKINNGSTNAAMTLPALRLGVFAAVDSAQWAGTDYQFASGLNTDTISESSGGAGVTVDGLLIKDGGLVDVAADIQLEDAVDLSLGTGDDALLRWSTGDASNHSTVLALGDSNQALHITDKGAVATDWNVSADTHPTVYVHSNTTPATDYMTIGAHDGTTGHVNVVGGTTLSLDIAGTAEATVTAAGIQLPSGNSLAADTIVETTAAAGVTIDGVLVKDTGIFNADLTLNSTNKMTIQFAAVGAIQIDDSAISGFAGAADTAGKDTFIETQTGGAASADTSGVDGADLTITAGDGSAGGAHTSNNPDGGNAGNIILAPGVGGAAGAGGSGVAGDPGKVKVSSGLLHFTNAQTLDMNDATVALTLNPGTPAGTTITSNTMAVDPNSGGGTEDLLLPPEADCNGLALFIMNTGGEDIVVKDDAAGTTVCTIATTESAWVACDGTTWRGGVVKTT